LPEDPVTGDVWLARLDPVEGSEQGRARPVAVFQNPDLARFTTTVLCVPLTANPNRLGLPGTCFIPRRDGGLERDSIALGFHLRALDRGRLARRLGRLEEVTVELLADAILDALGIEVADV
jgi:mRNA interferase MazF